MLYLSADPPHPLLQCWYRLLCEASRPNKNKPKLFETYFKHLFVLNIVWYFCLGNSVQLHGLDVITGALALCTIGILWFFMFVSIFVFRLYVFNFSTFNFRLVPLLLVCFSAERFLNLLANDFELSLGITLKVVSSYGFEINLGIHFAFYTDMCLHCLKLTSNIYLFWNLCGPWFGT